MVKRKEPLMKNGEILELRELIETCIKRFHKTEFCLGLAHNKRILDPIVKTIEEELIKLRPDTDSFKNDIQVYQNKADTYLASLAVKDAKGEPVRSGPSTYRIESARYEEAVRGIEKIKQEASAQVRKYLDDVEKVKNMEYENPISFYLIKSSNLPENLGYFADGLFPLIREE